MVSPVYRHSVINAELHSRPGSQREFDVLREQQRMAQHMEAVFPKLHVLTIGPGLGRDANVLKAVGQVIAAARRAGVPLVLDADAYVHACGVARAQL